MMIIMVVHFVSIPVGCTATTGDDDQATHSLWMDEWTAKKEPEGIIIIILLFVIRALPWNRAPCRNILYRDGKCPGYLWTGGVGE